LCGEKKSEYLLAWRHRLSGSRAHPMNGLGGAEKVGMDSTSTTLSHRCPRHPSFPSLQADLFQNGLVCFAIGYFSSTLIRMLRSCICSLYFPIFLYTKRRDTPDPASPTYFSNPALWMFSLQDLVHKSATAQQQYWTPTNPNHSTAPQCSNGPIRFDLLKNRARGPGGPES
jgi:hypothetical protein